MNRPLGFNLTDPKSTVKIDRDTSLTSISFYIPLFWLQKRAEMFFQKNEPNGAVDYTFNMSDLYLYLTARSHFINKKHKYNIAKKHYNLQKGFPTHKLEIDIYEFKQFFETYFQLDNSSDFFNAMKSFATSEFVAQIDSIMTNPWLYGSKKRFNQVIKSQRPKLVLKTESELNMKLDELKALISLTVPIYADKKHPYFMTKTRFDHLVIRALAMKPEATYNKKYNVHESMIGLSHEKIALLTGHTHSHVTKVLRQFTKIYTFDKINQETFLRIQMRNTEEPSEYTRVFEVDPKIQEIDAKTGEIKQQKHYFALVGSKTLNQSNFKFWIRTKTGKKTLSVSSRATKSHFSKNIQRFTLIDSNTLPKNSKGLDNLNWLFVSDSGLETRTPNKVLDAYQSEQRLVFTGKSINEAIHKFRFLVAYKNSLNYYRQSKDYKLVNILTNLANNRLSKLGQFVGSLTNKKTRKKFFNQEELSNLEHFKPIVNLYNMLNQLQLFLKFDKSFISLNTLMNSGFTWTRHDDKSIICTQTDLYDSSKTQEYKISRTQDLAQRKKFFGSKFIEPKESRITREKEFNSIIDKYTKNLNKLYIENKELTIISTI